MKPLHLLISVICLLHLCSCKKLIEDKQRDALIAIMTNGQWYVESYLEGSVAITDQFAGYNFQFKEDGSVTGINGSLSTSGTWVGDVSNYSITSNFPSAANPLKKLNGTWIVKDSGLDFVKAEMKTSTGIMQLRLRKTP